MARNLPLLNLDEAVELINCGGIVIYETETFCALGCRCDNAQMVNAIYNIKCRPTNKPLPLLAADLTQANLAVDLVAAPIWLMALYWPGPLTLVLPAKRHLAPRLLNAQHKAALRISACASAANLAKRCGRPITATSANLSGQPPPETTDNLDAKLLAACAKSGIKWGVFKAKESQKGNSRPSTLIEPDHAQGRWKLRILREGALSREMLQNYNWDLL